MQPKKTLTRNKLSLDLGKLGVLSESPLTNLQSARSQNNSPYLNPSSRVFTENNTDSVKTVKRTYIPEFDGGSLTDRQAVHLPHLSNNPQNYLLMLTPSQI